jgi:hypothetical protein
MWLRIYKLGLVRAKAEVSLLLILLGEWDKRPGFKSNSVC